MVTNNILIDYGNYIIKQGREFFDKHVKEIIDDENILSFGAINKDWYKRWNWILIYQGYPLLMTVEPTTMTLGKTTYVFNFDEKGNLSKGSDALVH